MRKKTHEQFIDEIKKANPSIIVLSNYVNSRTKIKVQGKNCGHIWETRPYDLLNGHGCPECRYINNSERTRYSNDQFLKQLENINPNIQPLDEYVTSQKHIRVRCKVCQFEWRVKPNTLLNGSGCANCAGLKKKTTEEFINELRNINPSIDVLGEYKGQRSTILVKCKNCKHEWKPTAKSLLIGRSCPECNKVGTSFMEQFILSAFRKELGNELVINRDREAIDYELDIYIPSKSLAIEPGSWYWHNSTFRKDTEKRKQCKEKGIRIITIYDTYPIEKEKPFKEDCFVFENQLNEPGYHRLKELVKSLFSYAGITPLITENYWNDIIDQAHKGFAKMSHEEFVQALKTISPSIEILGQYHNAKGKIRVRCKTCGYEWDTIPTLLLNGSRCRSCIGLKRKTSEQFKTELNDINPTIEVLGEYINTHTKIKVRSKTCGHEWETSPSSLLRGSKCPICAGNQRKTHKQFIDEMRLVNPSITIVGTYSNATTKIEVCCNICGRAFYMTPNHLLNGHGCKYCNIKHSKTLKI